MFTLTPTCVWAETKIKAPCEDFCFPLLSQVDVPSEPGYQQNDGEAGEQPGILDQKENDLAWSFLLLLCYTVHFWKLRWRRNMNYTYDIRQSGQLKPKRKKKRKQKWYILLFFFSSLWSHGNSNFSRFGSVGIVKIISVPRHNNERESPANYREKLVERFNPSRKVRRQRQQILEKKYLCKFLI